MNAAQHDCNVLPCIEADLKSSKRPIATVFWSMGAMMSLQVSRGGRLEPAFGIACDPPRLWPLCL